jgi:hypothetical protein
MVKSFVHSSFVEKLVQPSLAFSHRCHERSSRAWTRTGPAIYLFFEILQTRYWGLVTFRARLQIARLDTSNGAFFNAEVRVEADVVVAAVVDGVVVVAVPESYLLSTSTGH